VKKITAIILSCLGLGSVTQAQDARWITFRTSHNNWGAIEHQIDRQSIHQEGPYKIFWTRIWLAEKHQPLVFNRNEALVFLSQKFAVDCAQLQFGSQFIDSNEPAQMKHKASLKTMRWENLAKFPAVGRVVCGER
jgi:hypothetical protein